MPDTQMFPLVPVQREGQSAWRQTKSLKDRGRLPVFGAKSVGHMLAGSLSSPPYHSQTAARQTLLKFPFLSPSEGWGCRQGSETGL